MSNNLFDSITRLTDLSLAFNKIKEIKSSQFFKLKDLTSLNLEANLIENLYEFSG